MIKKVKYWACALALATSGTALAQNSGWLISEADGQVSVIRDGKPIYGAQGTRLEIGDVIRTSGAARAVLARGDKFFVVAPKSQVRIKPAKSKGTIAQMFEYLGDTLLRPGSKSKEDKQVLAAVVKGYGDEKQEIDDAAIQGAMNSYNPGN